jgi:hypothetical protein
MFEPDAKLNWEGIISKRADALVYMGKVGIGWSRTVSSQIRKQLDAVVGLSPS